MFGKKREKKEEGLGTVIICVLINLLTGGLASLWTARIITRAINNMKKRKAVKLAVESGDEKIIKAVNSSTKKTEQKKETSKKTTDKKATEPKKTATKKVVKKVAVEA